MNANQAVRRAQVYGFLSSALLYPEDNWTEDLPLLSPIIQALPFMPHDMTVPPTDLDDLQRAHRRAFGLTGSLCYESEYGQGHEFRHSQEMADINAFYRAFGFTVGGPVRERPDHLAVELEFMHIMALKEAHAASNGLDEHFETCLDAQRKFLQDHLGTWIDLVALSLAMSPGEGVYPDLVRFAAAFVNADAARLDVEPERRQIGKGKPAPIMSMDFSCGDCPAFESLS